MKLLPKQENAVYYLKDKTTTELVFGGAAGGAKSSLGCLWLIENSQSYPGTRWLMGRSKLKTLKETTLNTFFEMSTKLGVNDEWNYNAMTGVIKWTNGSEIILKDLFFYPSDPNFDSLGSLEISGAFIDECNQINFKAWQVVKSRIRYKLTEYDLTPKILGTCNPSKNWVYKYFFRAKKTKDIAPFRKFIQSLPKDNPFLPDSYIESLSQLDDISRERLLNGNWEFDNDKSAIISYNAIMDYWNAKHIVAGPGDENHLTIDVARKGKDKTVFRVWKGWLCVKRYEMAISTIPQIVEKAQKIQAAFKITNSNTIADEDGVGGGVVDVLRCKGFINNSKPLYDAAAKDGDINYSNLKNQCSIRMAKRINAKTVGETCNDNSVIELTSEEMEQIKYAEIDKDGKAALVTKDKIKALIGRSPDDWDSIMMREWFSLRVKYESF